MNDPQAGAIRRLETELAIEHKARIAERDRIEFLTKALDQLLYYLDRAGCHDLDLLAKDYGYEELAAYLKEKQAP